MFLNQLNEKEKMNFFDLAFSLVYADGEFSGDERALLTQYLSEMALDIDLDTFQANQDIDSSILSFADSQDQIVKMIFIELIGLVYVDKHFDDIEKEIIEKYMRTHNIQDQAYKNIKDSVLQINKVYTTFSKFIQGQSL